MTEGELSISEAVVLSVSIISFTVIFITIIIKGK